MSTIQNVNGWDIIFSPNTDASSPYKHEIEPDALLFVSDLVSRVGGGNFTIRTPVANPLYTGSIVYVSGFSGEGITDGQYTVTVIDSTHFELNSTPGSNFSITRVGSIIQIYDTSTGSNLFWVKVPTVSHTVNTEFYMFYNKGGVTMSPEDPVSLWSAANSIFHFPRGYPFRPYLDSTGNGNNLSQGSNVIQAFPGELGSGIGALTGGDVLTKNPYTLDLTDFTICFWMNSTTSFGNPQPIRFFMSSGNDPGFIQNTGATPNPSWITNNLVNTFNSLIMPLNQWTFYALKVNSAGAVATCIIGNPGVGISSQTLTGLSAQAATTTQLNIYYNVSFATAALNLDEFQIYPSGTISDDFIKTLFNNQSDSSFVTIGAETVGAAGYNFKRKITISPTMVSGSSNLSNFPLVIDTVLLPVGPPPPPPDVTGDIRYTLFTGGASSVSPPPTPPPIIVTRKCKPNMADFI